MLAAQAHTYRSAAGTPTRQSRDARQPTQAPDGPRCIYTVLVSVLHLSRKRVVAELCRRRQAWQHGLSQSSLASVRQHPPFSYGQRSQVATMRRAQNRALMRSCGCGCSRVFRSCPLCHRLLKFVIILKLRMAGPVLKLGERCTAHERARYLGLSHQELQHQIIEVARIAVAHHDVVLPKQTRKHTKHDTPTRQSLPAPPRRARTSRACRAAPPRPACRSTWSASPA